MACMGTLATTTIYYIDPCGLGQLERPARELSLLQLLPLCGWAGGDPQGKMTGSIDHHMISIFYMALIEYGFHRNF
jgi:hypothetical protein